MRMPLPSPQNEPASRRQTFAAAPDFAKGSFERKSGTTLSIRTARSDGLMGTHGQIASCNQQKCVQQHRFPLLCNQRRFWLCGCLSRAPRTNRPAGARLLLPRQTLQKGRLRESLARPKAIQVAPCHGFLRVCDLPARSSQQKNVFSSDSSHSCSVREGVRVTGCLSELARASHPTRARLLQRRQTLL